MNKHIVIVSLIGVAGFLVTVWLRPDVDVLVVFTVVSAFSLQVINIIKSSEAHAAADAAAVIADEARKATKETSHAVNSRLDQLIVNAEMAARAEGLEEGRTASDARTDKLADQDRSADG